MEEAADGAGRLVHGDRDFLDAESFEETQSDGLPLIGFELVQQLDHFLNALFARNGAAWGVVSRGKGVDWIEEFAAIGFEAPPLPPVAASFLTTAGADFVEDAVVGDRLEPGGEGDVGTRFKAFDVAKDLHHRLLGEIFDAEEAGFRFAQTLLEKLGQLVVVG